MDIKNVGLYLLIWVNVFLLVKAQVVFNPDPEDDVLLEVTPLTPNVSVTTDQCYSSSPVFTVQYVTTDGKDTVHLIYSGNNSHSVDGVNCGGSQNLYRVNLISLLFIADPVLVGGTFKLKVTLDNNEGNSTLSKRTYTFPAPFNLTGSSVSAVLHHEFTWTCHVTSDYPIIEWHRGSTTLTQIGVLHNNSCVLSGQNDSYTYNCQPSALTYTLTIPGPYLTEELQETTWRCRHVNTSIIATSKFMKFDVVYPPTVTLYFQNTTENTENHIIRCTAEGKPNNVTIVALEQRIGLTLIRNITIFTESSPGNITWKIPRVSYQDMGTYTCLASNGIPDRSNQTIQKDTAYLNVNTSAKFEMMQYTVRSDIDTPVVVRIPFYRNPPARNSDMIWTRNTGASNETLKDSSNFSFYLNASDVQQTLHGKDATLKGQSAIMTIKLFNNYYEGNYTLKIKSGGMDSGEVAIVILRSGPPDTPSGFQVLSSKVNSVVLTWNKGSDGGHTQTFVILYKVKNSWVYKLTQIQDTTTNVNVSYEIKDLKSDTVYDFRLYSFNDKGNSTGQQPLEARTLKAPVVSAPSSLNSGLVGGAAGGGAAVLVVIIVIIVVVRRRKNQEGKRNEFNSRETLAGSPRQKGDDEGGDGLKDNPLYGGNPGGANAVQGASAARGNPGVYAEVVKPKKKSPVKVSEDPPPIYAEVDKSSKKNAKGKQKKQNAKDTAGGEQYQNMDGFKQTGSTDKKKAKENEQRGYKNKDGLFYMDVKFDQQPTRGKPTIRKEEPTGYAMIQFEESNAKSTSSNARGAEGGQ